MSFAKTERHLYITLVLVFNVRYHTSWCKFLIVGLQDGERQAKAYFISFVSFNSARHPVPLLTLRE